MYLLQEQLIQGLKELVDHVEKESARQAATYILSLVHDHIPEELRQEIGKKYSY